MKNQPPKTMKTSSKKTSKPKSELQEIEQWIIQRKKFLIKLTWIFGITATLVILSNIYLKVQGVGI